MKRLDEVMQGAHLHACSLAKERLARPSGEHVDDHRVCTEIANHQFHLGRMEKELRDQNERMLAAIDQNKAHIAEIREIYGRLQAEMDIATFRSPPEVKGGAA